MAEIFSRPYVTRGQPIPAYAPRVAALFMELEARWSDYDAAPDGADEAALRRVWAVAERIEALQIRSISEAASLLQAVFLDEDAFNARNGLPEREQAAVLAKVRVFLAAHVAAIPERSL